MAHLDDILIIGRSIAEAEKAYHQVKQLLEDLGFVINLEKQHNASSFLGFLVNSSLMTFKLPTAKVKDIKSRCKQALRQKTIIINIPVGVYHRCLVINSPCNSPNASALSRLADSEVFSSTTHTN